MRKKFLIIFLVLIVNSGFAIGADNQGGVFVTFADSGDCVLSFSEGWNLFSFCSELNGNEELVTLLSPLEGRYRYVMVWDKVTQVFEIYSPRGNDAQPFDVFDDDKSYFIYMEEPAVLEIDGSESGLESRDLVEGWNSPSYPYRSALFIEDLIGSFRNDFRYLMKWSAVRQEFDIYSLGRSDAQPFIFIDKGEGQFIYLRNPNTLVYAL